MIKDLKRAAQAESISLAAAEHGGLFMQSRHAQQSLLPARIDLAEYQSAGQYSVGIREVFSEMYGHLGWDRLLDARRTEHQHVLRELVLARLQNPGDSYDRSQPPPPEYRADVELGPEQVCKTLDFLDEIFFEDLCDRSFVLAEQLYGRPISMMFCDISVLTFETDIADGPYEMGPGEYDFEYDIDSSVDILLALLMTADGIPCGYRALHGSYWDAETVIDIVDSLSKRHPTVRFTVAGESRTLGAKARKTLVDNNIPYMHSTRIETGALDPNDYLPWPTPLHITAPGDQYKKSRPASARPVATSPPKQADPDAHGPESPDDDSGQAAAPTVPAREAERAPDNVAAKARELSSIEIRRLIATYRGARNIKAGFRNGAYELERIPAIDWTDSRIEAYIAVCYMAFCCLQHLRGRLVAQGHSMSPDVIQSELSYLAIAVVRHRYGFKECFGIPSRATDEAERIYRSLELKWNTTPFVIAAKGQPGNNH